MKLHELKTDPDSFDAVERRQKKFEIRLNDRDFNVGDLLMLRRTNYTGEEMKAGSPLQYTGKEILVRVCSITRGPIYGLADGWVIMSIYPIIMHPA